MSLLAVWWLAASLTIASAQQAAPHQPSVEEKERLAERNRGWQQLQKLRSEGQTVEAIEVAEELLTFERTRPPEETQGVVRLLGILSELHLRRDEFDKAAGYRTEILAITTGLHGADDWRVKDARRDIKHVGKLSDMTAAERARVRTADARHQEGIAHHQRGNVQAAISSEEQSWEIYRDLLGAEDLHAIQAQENLAFLHEEANQPQDAERLYRRVLALRQALHGREHPGFAQNLHNLALLYQSMGDHAKAEPLYRQALGIRRATIGEKHAHYADSLNNLANVYQSIGSYVKAEQLHRQALEIRKEVLGEKHPHYALSLHSLATVHHSNGDYEEADRLYRQALAVRKEVLGERHPHYIQSLYNLAELCRVMGMYAKAEPLYRLAVDGLKEVVGEKHPDYATGLTGMAEYYRFMGNYAEAGPLYRQALAIRKEAQGEKSIAYAGSLNNLAEFYRSTGEYAKAEGLYRQCLSILKQALGEKHPAFAQCANNLGLLYQVLGVFTKAEHYCLQSLEIRREVLGERHPHFAQSLTNAANLYQLMGHYAKAERLHREALAIRQCLVGEEHPDYAESLNNLAELSRSMGGYANAERLCRKALRIFKESLGEQHPRYATGLNNLATLYWSMGDFAKAEYHFRQTLAIRIEVLGEKHPDSVRSLSNLASLYQSVGEHGKAEPLQRRALAALRERLGPEHPDCALVLNNLAMLHEAMGEYDKAGSLHRQALEIRKLALHGKHPAYAASLNNLAVVNQLLGNYAEAREGFLQAMEIHEELGQEHPYYALSLANLGLLCAATGDPARAEDLLRKSLRITTRLLEWTAAAQSERQQIAMAQAFRATLDAYLSISDAAGVPAGRAYELSLVRKGRVFARQQLMRLARCEPELSSEFAQLDQTVQRLATLALATPAPEQWKARQQQLAELSETKERLEAELNRQSAAFREASKTVPVAAVQEALPETAVLVDFLEYSRMLPPPGNERRGMRFEPRLTAFIVRPQKPVVRMELGAAEPLVAAIERWRETYGRSAQAVEAARAIRKRIWKPLEKYLQGAELVLVAPDGALGRFPLAALPGRKPNTYLLEEQMLAVVPAPQALPMLVGDQKQPPAAASLLALGGVDYDADAEQSVEQGPEIDASGDTAHIRSIVRGGNGLRFEPLKGTADEVAHIAELYRGFAGAEGLTTLVGNRASEGILRQQAPLHRYLHLATHGYFAPPALRPLLAPAPTALEQRLPGNNDFTVARFHPGLLSGLALAGANRPQPGGPDGILSAEEVAALDLTGVEMAVLSACETGLGRVAGGEGVLGLQRAFQASGARTTVTSLWQVHDRATQLLMSRFYENLWQRKMGKLEALREAQLWMLRESGRPERDGSRAIDELPQDQPADPDGRLPPYYWAAFVLSGDWR